MVIVGGMARFSPALIYRRFIFETRSVGGVLALTAYNTRLLIFTYQLLVGIANLLITAMFRVL